MAAYDEAADWYDRVWSSRRDHVSDVEVISSIVDGLNPGADSLLDLGCATGEHLGLLQDRYSCVGVDTSAGLLRVARAKLDADVSLHEADMFDLELDCRFDVIVCLWGTVAYARTFERLEQAAGRMAAHLRRPGIAIVEPWLTLQSFPDQGSVTVTIDDDEQPVLAVVASTSKQGSIAHLQRTYVAATSDSIRTVEESHELGLFSEAQYRTAFETAGFEVEWDEDGLAGRGLLVGVL